MRRYPPANRRGTDTLRWPRVSALWFSVRHSFRTGRLVGATPVAGGMQLRSGRYVVPPPIRFTPWELERMAEDYFLWDASLRPGDVVIDIGAGMGTELPTYSARVGSHGKVFGFEAHPRSFQIASEVVALNRLHNVRLVHAAVWNEPGTIKISDDPDSLGVNSVVEHALLASRWIEVPAVRLDEWLLAAPIDRIDLLKLNVEGAELGVLKGAEQALSIARRVVVACHDFVAEFEGGSDRMRTKKSVSDILVSQGFEVNRRDHRNPAIADTLYATRR